MSKKVLKIAALAIALACVLFLGIGIIKKSDAKKTIRSKIQTISKVKLLTLDSSVYSFPEGTVVIIFFNSGCEHCQYELREIKTKYELFSNVELVLLSSEDISVIKKASEDFGLTQLPKVHFAKINHADVFDNFGAFSFPYVLVYDSNHKLVKEFKGETKVEAIAKHLP
jgi:thiol-disulfide isomerase/thioredoxin